MCEVSFPKLNNFTRRLVADTLQPRFQLYCVSSGRKSGMNRTKGPDLLPYCSNINMKNIL